MPTTSSVCRSPSALPAGPCSVHAREATAPRAANSSPSQPPRPPCASHANRRRRRGRISASTKTLLLRGKFGADPAVLHLLGRFLALSCKDLPKPDAIVPVPLHSTRLRERGFNQCQELARPLSDALGVPLVPDLLLRQHPTRHQVGLSEAERVANLKSAFLSLPEVRGKRILLVDDTYTTGTTLRRAALALLDPHAGAAAVDVAVVARTPREKHDFQYNWSSPHESLPKNS